MFSEASSPPKYTAVFLGFQECVSTFFMFRIIAQIKLLCLLKLCETGMKGSGICVHLNCELTATGFSGNGPWMGRREKK